MDGLRFSKMHGLGNDFVIVDWRKHDRPPLTLDVNAVRAMCDRRRGIGADGVICILPPDTSHSAARMRVLNADGSEPQMCGNGIRCVARYLYDHRERPDSESVTLIIDSGAGPRTCVIDNGSAKRSMRDRALQVRVDMGIAQFERETLPMCGAGPFIEGELEIAGTQIRGTAVSMGNPHWVLFPAEGDLEQMATQLGPSIERHAAFPERTNVEFARLRAAAEIEVWVWERGVGITQACGTGACATVAAAIATQRLDPAQPARVHLPGGCLEIDVASDESSAPGSASGHASMRYRVWMTGPAMHVYDGVW